VRKFEENIAQNLIIWLNALRVRQWHKNFLVFIPLIFAFQISNLELVIRTFYLFVAFCAASSSVYLFNDLLDKKQDLLHPLKKDRAVASGRISTRTAMILAGILLVFSLLLVTLTIPISASLILISYLILQFFYNLGLRNIPAADVISIALGFVLRAVGGAVAISVPFSEWLLICTFFGAVRLALGKRQAELTAGKTGLRLGWEELGQDFARILGAITSAALTVSYTLYCFASATARILGHGSEGSTFEFPPLLLSLPVVYFGIMRYEILASKGVAGDPELLIVKDKELSASIVIWFIITFAALYLWRN